MKNQRRIPSGLAVGTGIGTAKEMISVVAMTIIIIGETATSHVK
jgi:hypothetical protein